MSTLKVLKEYLVGDGGYLLNDDNNGKTVMLSGAWGSGKTHFWQKDIVPELIDNFKDNNRACVYVSLYGKESLKAIKQEVFLKASDEKDYLSEEVETFGIDALSSLEDSDANWAKIVKSFWDLNETRRGQKGQNRLKDGGLICFDDFERKSKKVDLNDLFGFISQLAIGLNCKVVIILNSDVFEGEEANVFKTVKEKTVNKFFYFEPTIEELFNSIYESNEKYKKLDSYKDEILKAIEETEELNARIYIQVLDNCLEWIENSSNDKVLRNLVLVTINFILNHIILPKECKDSFVFPKQFLDLSATVNNILKNLFSQMEIDEKLYDSLLLTITKDDVPDISAVMKEKDNFSTLEQRTLYLDEIKKNEFKLKSIFKYFYKLRCHSCNDYEKINQFVQSGILPKKDKELSS